MFEQLEAQSRLTRRQRLIVIASALGCMFEFFDYFVIGFVLAFVVVPWQLTFGETAVILLSSGIGAIMGSFICGLLADRIGRRKLFIATILIFSIGTGIMAFTPEKGWLFLSFFRLVVGFGVGGMYAVDMSLVQEFVPGSKRGFVSGLISAFIPAGSLLGSLLSAFLAPAIGWRSIFLIGLVPALLVLVVRSVVPESPRWLFKAGRYDEARRSLAWVLEIKPDKVALPDPATLPATRTRPWTYLFRYPRSLAVSWLVNIGGQTGLYGLALWAPTLLVLLLNIPASEASFLMIFVTLGGIGGRFSFGLISDRIGRRKAGMVFGFGAAVILVITSFTTNLYLGTLSVFWLFLILTYFIADGGLAIAMPYAAEVWPADLRATGLGAAYGFGGIGKIIGPMGLALIIGSSNVITPAAKVEAIVPAFFYLAGWYLVVGIAYLVFGIETKGRSIEEIEQSLEKTRSKLVSTPTYVQATAPGNLAKSHNEPSQTEPSHL